MCALVSFPALGGKLSFCSKRDSRQCPSLGRDAPSHPHRPGLYHERASGFVRCAPRMDRSDHVLLPQHAVSVLCHADRVHGESLLHSGTNPLGPGVCPSGRRWIAFAGV